MGLRAFLVALVFGLLVDLGTKVVAVGLDRHDGWLAYNDRPGAMLHRLVMALLALLATAVLARLARWRGMGEIWGAWVGCGLLVAGIAGNGVSRLVWSRGVPDFIHLGNWIWNVADFEISLGLVGGLASIVVSGLGAWIRERRIAKSRFSTSISEPM